MLGAHSRSRAGFVTAALALPGERREERELREQADELLERLGLADVADRPRRACPTARSSASSWPARSASGRGC